MISDYIKRDWKKIVKNHIKYEKSKDELSSIQRKLYKLSHRRITEKQEEMVQELTTKRDQLKERIMYLEQKIGVLMK